MRRTVITLTSLFILWTSAVYAVNPTDVKNLPPHKQAKLGPVGHDTVPGYVEQEPINDVIHSATPRELQPQENTLKTQRLTGLTAPAAPAGNDITKENLKLVFDPFMQVEEPEKTGKTGTGLGLAITREYCHLLDGVLEATSTPGEGSLFTANFAADILAARVRARKS